MTYRLIYFRAECACAYVCRVSYFWFNFHPQYIYPVRLSYIPAPDNCIFPRPFCFPSFLSPFSSPPPPPLVRSTTSPHRPSLSRPQDPRTITSLYLPPSSFNSAVNVFSYSVHSLSPLFGPAHGARVKTRSALCECDLSRLCSRDRRVLSSRRVPSNYK